MFNKPYTTIKTNINIFISKLFQINYTVNTMDFSSQPKLSKAEWQSVEEPVPADEQLILRLIIDGYNNVNVKHNTHLSLISIAKLEKSDPIENYLYQKFFKSRVTEAISFRGLPQQITTFNVKEITLKQLKKSDIIRLENMSGIEGSHRTGIEGSHRSGLDAVTQPFEYVLLDFAKEMLKLFSPAYRNNRYAFYLYTLIQLRGVTIDKLNKHVLDFIDLAIQIVRDATQLSNIIANSYEFIEKNPHIYKYGDISLYDHQKRLFSVFKQAQKQQTGRYTHVDADVSNLVLYVAPTGTGKTLSPIGLSNSYRVIYVCAARHIGIALAKSAISVQKCTAFAFGCETAADIRLHYYSALSYTINKRSGGIGKVDNSVGNKVEIMICDAKSYLVAMYYMLSFNKATDIITYWDEPTIGMDVTNVDNVLHEITHRNWSENKIPNMVLSSATLPSTAELEPVLDDFRMKFDNVVITEINSYDCNKSITLLNKNGYSVCPHLLHEDYDKMVECVEFCQQNKTLLRYFDLSEVVRFIEHMTKAGRISEDYSADEYFDHSIEKIKMNSIKMYYMDLLKQIDRAEWPFIYKSMKDSLRRNMPGERNQANDLFKKSVSVDSSITLSGNGNANANTGALKRTTSVYIPPSRPKTALDLAREKSEAAGRILLTTVDAHTLTDGPTIYLAEDVDKIGSFYVQQSNIPKDVFDNIMTVITHNNAILKSVEVLEAELEDVVARDAKGEKKPVGAKGEKVASKATDGLSAEARRIDEKIDALKSGIQLVTLDPIYIPNTVAHQSVWVSDDKSKTVENAFVPYIDPTTARDIMGLEIPDSLKVLLLLGIGMFSFSNNSTYSEIIKRLAYNKQLFIIVASSDYIYGTNYQFCHGFIGKDLLNMTQQKTIQALGRIGRNNIQQEYSARFRDDAIIENLFKRQTENVEAVNMCRLLVTDGDEEEIN